MTNPVMIVRNTYRHGAPHHKWRTCWMWCPACEHAVAIPVAGLNGELPGAPDGPYWEWDGNLERPTFDPSILQSETRTMPKCHSYIRNGQWQFLSDCTHSMASKTVDMVPLPDWLFIERRDDGDEQVDWDD